MIIGILTLAVKCAYREGRNKHCLEREVVDLSGAESHKTSGRLYASASLYYYPHTLPQLSIIGRTQVIRIRGIR